MKTLRILFMAAGLLYGVSDLALAKDVTFKVTDVPGYWFDTGVDIAGTHSLAIIAPGDMVKFKQHAESRHTVTSLIWPSNAKSERTDRPGRGEYGQSPCETAYPGFLCLCVQAPSLHAWSRHR